MFVLKPNSYTTPFKFRLKFYVAIVFLLLGVNVSFSQKSSIQTSGDVILYALPATAITTTLLLKDLEGTEQFAEGFFLTQIVTHSLKTIVKKERPDGNGFDSFPSGHTSTTFQSAAFIQRRYGWTYGIPAYLLAGWTGYSRIEADRHDLTDVLTGAAIGIASSYLFTKPYEKQSYELSLSGGLDGVMVRFNYRF